MVELSRDGSRIYVTNGLFTPVDAQFYPDGFNGWMAKITHHNAVGVYDFRRSQSMGYIEMELVPGINLHDFLKQRHGEPLPLVWIAQNRPELSA